MKKEIYVIVFSDGEKIEHLAWSYEEANKSAQAKRIREGKNAWDIIDWYIKRQSIC